MADKELNRSSWFMESRYFLLAIVLSFVIVAAIAFLLSYRHHTMYTEQILKEDRSAAKLLSLVLEQRLKGIVAVMESYSQRPLLIQAVRDKNVAKARVHLLRLQASDPDIDILSITDRQGTLWMAQPERPEALGQNFAQRDWYKNVSKERKTIVSDVVLRVVRERDTAIQISVPVFDEKQEVIGILTSTQRTVDLGKLFIGVHGDPGSTISVADRKGRIIFSSRYAFEKEITPYPFLSGLKKALASNDKTFAAPDPAGGGQARYISFAAAGELGWIVMRERDKNSIFQGEYAYFLQIAASAFFLFLAVVMLLVYARKQATARQLRGQLQLEKEKSASAARFRSFIDATMQIGWTTNGSGEIVEDNPSWSRYTGRGFEEIKGMGWMEDIHPDDRGATERLWAKAVADKGLYENEYRLRRGDGVYRHYLACGIPLFAEDGNIREWVGACIDISERKQAEEEIRKLNAELEQRVSERTAQLTLANRELEAFSYSVSHDLRAPLRSIDGFSQALLEDYREKPLDDAGRSYLVRVRKATQRMGLLIDDMLKLSRITKAEMKVAAVDLSGMVSAISEEFQKNSPDRVVAVTVQGGIMVQADPDLLKIAIFNLLDNAFKFTGREAHPHIEFGAAPAQEGGNVCFIRDNGVGFDMAYVGKLFGAFQRLQAMDEFPGTGIGLATVQRVMHRHGGRVWAEGEIGKGATFYFTLPSAAAGL